MYRTLKKQIRFNRTLSLDVYEKIVMRLSIYIYKLSEKLGIFFLNSVNIVKIRTPKVISVTILKLNSLYFHLQ